MRSGFARWIFAVAGIGLCGVLLQPHQPSVAVPSLLVVSLPPLPEWPEPVPEPAPVPVAAVKVPRVYKCPVVGTRIVLIGDSFGEGLDPHLQRRASNCGANYVSDVRRGTSASQWVRWIGPVIAYKPVVVVISLGGNDFQGDAELFRTAIDEMVTRLRGGGARVLWVEPLSLPYPDQTGVRQMWKDAVGEDWFRSEHLEYGRAKDGVHTSYLNYRDWAERIWPWVVLKSREASPGVGGEHG